MAFSESVIEQAWKKANGKCQCKRKTHSWHKKIRCNRILVLSNRGREGRGKWEPHHKVKTRGDILSNCEILCWDCHKATFS
jgi:hypothetical protein